MRDNKNKKMKDTMCEVRLGAGCDRPRTLWEKGKRLNDTEKTVFIQRVVQ